MKTPAQGPVWVDINVGYVLVPADGKLYKTEDGGYSWQEAAVEEWPGLPDFDKHGDRDE